MYLHLSQHISVTYFKNEAILLDLKQDKFYVFDEVKTELLNFLLERKWIRNPKGLYSLVEKDIQSDQTLSIMGSFINILMKQGLLQSSLHEEPFLKNHKGADAVGMPNIDWRLPLDASIKVCLSWPTLKALLLLLKVHMTLKVKGFYSLIQWVKNEGAQHHLYTLPSQKELNNLVHILNQACLLYPIRTKCLEWATTLTLMALKKNWKISLSIGVQNYPFISHAWCQLENEVIADSPALPERMAVILTAPFHKKEYP